MNEAAIVSAFLGIGVALLFLRLRALERRLNRLSRIEGKVDALLRSAGILFDPLEGVPPDVREALQHGQTIQAIRRLRRGRGVGIKEAKDFVDEARRRQVST